VLNLCREFHCLPSALLAEDAELLRMLRLTADDHDEEV
jgi:hypothetical protein